MAFAAVIIFPEYNYFEGRPIDVVAEHRRRLNEQIHERFRIRDANDPLAMSLTEFRRLFRMPQDLVVRLTNLIRPHVRQRRNLHRISLLRKVRRSLIKSPEFPSLCIVTPVPFKTISCPAGAHNLVLFGNGGLPTDTGSSHRHSNEPGFCKQSHTGSRHGSKFSSNINTLHKISPYA